MSFGLEQARSPECLFFECVSGSRAYGTDTPESDLDLRGVFVAPLHTLYGFERLEQVSDASHDQTYYELGRFVDLLCKNNPNLLEILFSSEDCIRYRHPLFQRFQPERFLSRLCESSFAGYALTQVRKARGLNKKIVNPVEKERKTLFEFCHVLQDQGSIPLRSWLEKHDLRQENCGLVNVPHMREVYAIFVDRDTGVSRYRGILSSPDSTMVLCSSVPRDATPAAWMSVNVDGFKKYCRNYREYWEWVEHRNEARYQTNQGHGRNYDSKNMMHTFRLLEIAREIATEKRITVRSPHREWLLRIRQGEFTYEELLQQATDRIEEIKELYARSDLPDAPDRAAAERLLVEVREAFYAR